MRSSSATLTVTLVDGTQVVVPDSLEQITPYVLQEQGDWFEDEIKFLRRLVQPGQTVVDIGANVGVYSLSLARRVGPTGQVWAFEPAAATAELLAESISANGTSWLHQERKALSDHTGTAWLQTPGQSELNSLAAEPQGPGEEVPLTTLDACLETFGWRQVDLLKIGAEGEEERILAGGRRFFAELSPLVMFELKAGAELHLELVETFQALGYSCYRLVPGLDALMPFDPAAGVDGYLLNLFAAKPDRAEALAAGGWLVPTTSPASPEDAELEPYHWRRVLTHLPYGQTLASSWQQQEGSEGSAVADPLALWAYAQDTAQPISRRLGALQKSHDILFRMYGTDESLVAGLSLARAALELGERSAAVQVLEQIIRRHLRDDRELVLDAPFLLPSSRHEKIDPGNRVKEWLKSSVLEAHEMHSHFSSYYTGVKTISSLELLTSLGFSDHEISRRIDLIRSRYSAVLTENTCTKARETEDNAQEKSELVSVSREAWEMKQRGDWSGAEALLTRVISMTPASADEYYHIGRSLYALGRAVDAISQYQEAIERDPENPLYRVMLAIALQATGRDKEAITCYEQSILQYCFYLSQNPCDHEALGNLGFAYEELGDLAQAKEAYQRCLAISPNSTTVLNRLAYVHLKNGEAFDSLEVWERLLQLDPANPDTMGQVGIVLGLIGELQSALDYLERTQSSCPDNVTALAALMFNYSVGGVLYARQSKELAQRFWNNYIAQHANDGKVTQMSLPAHAKGTGQGTLRIGFLSAEIKEHVVAFFLESFLKNHDKQMFSVDLIETVRYNDKRANHLRGLVNESFCISGMNDEDARERIIDRSYHVLVDTSGYTSNNRLSVLAKRCAPIQCHYIGYHATTGMPTIDYFIGDDEMAGSDLQDQFTERLWRLPRLWLAREIPQDIPEACSKCTDDSPTFGCFSQVGKIRAETIRYWAAVMHSIPSAKLYLKDRHISHDRAKNRILYLFKNCSISADRILFLPYTHTWHDHMECYNLIDIALDTTPWSNATTCFDSLAMGTPMLSIRGESMISRMSSSIVNAARHPEWIAHTPTQLADIAGEMTADLKQIRQAKRDLQSKVLNSELYNTRDLAYHLQNAFNAMCEQGNSGRS